jgi:hypothetical protein
MHRCKERGFCCGAGGARMWMEERIGKRINVERIDEALELNPDLVTTACPFCMVMLGDAVNAKKQEGEAKESLEVLDVAQILVRSLVPARAGAPAAEPAPTPPTTSPPPAAEPSSTTPNPFPLLYPSPGPESPPSGGPQT